MTVRRSSPLIALLLFGLAFGAAAFGLSVPGFDDHPGQLYRLWHVVLHGPAPWAWDPGWWAGYPELQFYPPGFFWLGWLVHRLSLGMLGVPGIYRGLLWLAYLAPGLSAFVLLARLLPNPWLALPGAFVTLTLSAGLTSGVEGGAHIGMLPARLGWALLPLLLFFLIGWLEDDRHAPWAAAPVLAILAVMHPAHVPAGVVLVGLGAALGRGRRWRRVAQAAVVLVIAAALTAVWSLPLLIRLEYTRALAWGRLTPGLLGVAVVNHPLLAVLVLLALIVRPAASPVGRVLALWPWAMVAVVVFDAGVLEPRGLRWLPADRVVDGMWLAFILAAGVGATALRSRRARLIGVAGSLAASIALSGPSGSLTLWPRSVEWPAYETVARGVRLQDLWMALRGAPPGRVLFVRSGIPLVYGSEWWRPHSHVTGLTPLGAGRDIVHGTFTHPSPIAALVYRGDPGPGPITVLAETLDGQTLFGQSLDRLEATTLAAYAQRLGVSVVVALEEDLPRLRALQEHPSFVARPPIGPFRLWQHEPAFGPPVPSGGNRWRLLPTGTPGEWVSTGTAYYPLWEATRGTTQLETRRGRLWDLEVKLDDTEGPVELVYGPGLAEWAGVVLSLLAGMAWLACYLCWRRAGSPDAGSPTVRTPIPDRSCA